MNALFFDSVAKQYPNGHWAVKDLSFRVRQGSFFGLLGLNGAGKSTCIRMLSTLERPTRGKINLFALEDVYSDPLWAKTHFGLMPQEINLNPFETVMHALMIQGGLFGLSTQRARQRIELLSDQLDVTPKLGERMNQLSGGMKRRIMLIRAILGMPPLLILDEPSAGLDIEAREKVWTLLKGLNREGMTLLLTSHYLEEVEQLCDEVAILQDGQLKLQAPMASIRAQRPKEATWLIQLSRTSENRNRTQLKLPDGYRWIQDEKLWVRLGELQSIGEVIRGLESLGLGVLEVRLARSELEGLLLSSSASF